jgi:hypothetical protein
MVFTRTDELLDRLGARQIVLVVGAGVSKQTSDDPRATWHGLLEDGIEFCRDRGADEDWAEAARNDLSGGNPILAAQRIRDFLDPYSTPARTPGLFAKWLLSSVGQLRVERFDVLTSAPQRSSLIDALWRLSCPLITTNYDTLIEDATGAGSVTWRNPALLQMALEGREPRFVVHIHGIWNDAGSVIFSHQDYGRSIENAEVSKALKSCAYRSALLFVGFGGGTADPTFGGLRQWLLEDLKWSLRSHFLLAPNEEVHELEKDLIDPLTVIGYGDGYGSLEPFIRSRLLPEVEGTTVGLTGSRHLNGSEIAAGLRAAGRPLRLNDAAVLVEAELRRCEEQLGCVNGLLNQIEDRLGPPPGHWPPIQQEERHRFYSTATELLSNWLAPEIDILRQTAETLRSPAADYLSALRATSGEANVADTTRQMLQSVRGAATAASETGRRAHDLLLDREGGSGSALWIECSASLSPMLKSLENSLERLIRSIDDVLGERPFAGGARPVDH